jgi:hypothetical protein
MFRPIIQAFVLAMLHTRQELAFGGSIALQFIGDDHAWSILESFEELPKKSFRRLCVPSALYQDIQHVAVLIDGSPQIRPFPIDGEKDLIQVPLVPTRRTAAAEFVRVRLPKLQTPLTHGFIGHDDPTLCQKFFDITRN